MAAPPPWQCSKVYAPAYFALALGALVLVGCAITNVVLIVLRRRHLVSWPKLLIAAVLWVLLFMLLDWQFDRDLPQFPDQV